MENDSSRRIERVTHVETTDEQFDEGPRAQTETLS